MAVIELIDQAEGWKTSSAGEKLLFLLLRNHQEWKFLSDQLTSANLRLARRFNDLSSFFIGASVLHLMQRMVKLANDVRDEESDRLEQIQLIRSRLCDILHVTPIEYSGDFGELVQEILTCAEQTGKTMGSSLRNKVLSIGPDYCYSCGYSFNVSRDDGSEVIATADHVWPRALGGDTSLENLLPACEACNGSKEYLASWQMAWIQPAVFADSDAMGGLKGLRREVRMALHMRAAMAYAQSNGSTLRDAYIAIGPRGDPERIDTEQGYDFFNLRVHNAEDTDVSWIPA
jgi:hypothetical protein